MEIFIGSTDQLLSLFDAGRPVPVLLLGAGASVRSGVPLTGELVELAARWKYCRIHHRRTDDPSVKRTDWLNWLHGHQWYDKSARPEDNYSEVVERLLVPKQDRKEFFLWSLNRNVPASSGYEDLLKLLDDGFVTTILTTNFDRVLPDLKAAKQRPHHLEVIRTPDETVAFSTSPTYPQLVYLHGAVEYYTDQNLRNETQTLRPTLVNLLTPVLRDHPLVVIGYRGAEPSVMHSLLGAKASAANCYPQGIYWCSLSATLHPLVNELAQKISPNLQLIVGPTFDELMRTIQQHCAKLPKPVVKSKTASSTLPFDMTPLSDATLDELDWGTITEKLVAYCRRTGIVVPIDHTKEWLTERLCDLDLAVRNGASPVPTIAGYLLFAKDPVRRIRSATVAVVKDGTTIRNITGNLWVQREMLIDLLDEVNQPFILKTRDSEVVQPYPKIALRELCTNALVHRSYVGKARLKVELQPNCIRITNPGGLVDEVAERVQTTLQKEIESGVTGIRGYRNAVVADVFCGTGAMEKKGSGLPDVHRSVLKNGGKVFFGPMDQNDSFRAVVFRRPEAVDEKTGTAAPAANVTRYVTNLLEFISIPKDIWISTLKAEVDVSDALQRPRFALGGDTDLSFVPGTPGARRMPTAELTATADGRRLFTGLLNACVQGLLENRGLIVDAGRKRAYFPRTTDGSREVRYQASMRQATRTVTKPYISRVSQRVLYWIHEAIWFGVERYSGQYALRLLPGYVFTTDGRQALLFHKRVGALATRKAARDFSLQVFNHLVFWSTILCGGNDHLVIPTGSDPIVVSGTYAGCNLQIPLVADTPFTPDPNDTRDDAFVAELEQEIAEDTEANSVAENEAQKHATQH